MDRPQRWVVAIALPVAAVLLVGLASPAGAGSVSGLPLPSPTLTPLPGITTSSPGLPALPQPDPTVPLPTGGSISSGSGSSGGSLGNGSSGSSAGALTGAVPAIPTGNAGALITGNPAADLYPQPPVDPVDSPQAQLVADLDAIEHRMQYLHNVLARTRTDLAYAEQHSGPVAQLIVGLTAPAAPAGDATAAALAGGATAAALAGDATAAAPDTPAGQVLALSAAIASGDAEMTVRARTAEILQARINQRVQPTISQRTVATASQDYRGGRLLRPVTGPVTSPFGNRFDPYYHVWQLHAGLDIGAPTGTPIVAAAGGRVTQAGPFGGYGNYTCIDHGWIDGQRLSTCYGHQSQILVAPGQVVRAGQVIGRVGATGAATGPHLHFEVRLGGRPTDPAPWI